MEACARGEIVRGYPMRGTVFLMAAADARWITQLCVDKSLRESERILKGRGMGEGHLERAAEIASELLADTLERYILYPRGRKPALETQAQLIPIPARTLSCLSTTDVGVLPILGLHNVLVEIGRAHV